MFQVASGSAALGAHITYDRPIVLAHPNHVSFIEVIDFSFLGIHGALEGSPQVVPYFSHDYPHKVFR